MTNKQWLITMLKRPDDLEGSDENRLREMIAAYPYFQAPYLLLARVLKIKSHPGFDEILPTVSLYAMDRARLYELVNKSLPPTEDHKLPESLPSKAVEIAPEPEEAGSEEAVKGREEIAANTEEKETKASEFTEPASIMEDVALEQEKAGEDIFQEELITQEPVEEYVEKEVQNVTLEETQEIKAPEPEIPETQQETEEETAPFVQNFPFSELEDEIPEALEERNEKIGPVVSHFSFSDEDEDEREKEKEEKAASEDSFQPVSNFAVDFSKIEKEEKSENRQEQELPEILFGKREREENLEDDKKEEENITGRLSPDPKNAGSIKKNRFLSLAG